MGYLKYSLSGSAGTVQSFSDPSYTVRAFSSSIRTVNINNYDTDYHTYYNQTSGSKDHSYYFGNTNPTSGIVYSKNQENWSAPSIVQSVIDSDQQYVLDSYTQYALESGDPTSPNADGNYNSGLSMTFSGTTEAISSYQDNLLQGSFSNAGTYYIQMPVWSVPGTSNTPTFDRQNSSITFSSSNSFDPTQSVTIPFNSSVLGTAFNSSGTADALWKINRDVLSDKSIVGSGSVDISNVKKIKFTLVSTGGTVSFKTGQMKLVPSTYSYNKANINTKEGRLCSEPMPSPITQSNLPILLQDGLKVKNFSHTAKINFNHLPNAGGTHEISLYGRVNSDFKYGIQASPDDSTNAYLKTQLLITSNTYTINIYENNYSNTNNVVYTSTYSKALIPGAYFLIVDYLDDTVQARFYSGESEHFIDQLKAETGYKKITNTWLNGMTPASNIDTGRGYAGYEFKPDAVGNFYVDYLYSSNAELGRYVSKTFNSYSPLTGVSLFPTNIPDNNLISSNISNFIRVDSTNNFILPDVNEVGTLANPQLSTDDVYVEEDTQIFYANKSLKVSKSENAKIAAVQYSSAISVNDFSKLNFKVKLRFNNVLNQGDFRLVLWDEKRTKIAYIAPIPDLVSDVWNDVEVALSSNKLFNNKFILEIGHYGEIVTTPPITDPKGYFWIEEPSFSIEAVEWEASNNGGKTYSPFFNKINGRYKAINFSSQNYYSSLLNKNPAIFWDFNTPYTTSSVIPARDKEGNKGLLITNNGITTSQQTISAPGSVLTAGGTSYPVPDSTGSYLKNSAIAIYGGTDSYVSTNYTSGTIATLGNILSVAPGTAYDLSASIRFYSDTINNKINLVSCQDANGTALGSWNLNIQGTATYRFDCSGFGTVSGTVPTSTNPGYETKTWDDHKWHTASFTFNKTYNRISLYWDGQFIGAGTLSSNIYSNDPLRVLGPTATNPHNTYNSFNPALPFLFVDNISVYNNVLTQQEINQDYIASTSSYNQLKFRAKAYAKNAWILGYEAIPIYAQLGRLKEAAATKFITLNETITFTETSPQETAIIFDQAMFDVSQFGQD